MQTSHKQKVLIVTIIYILTACGRSDKSWETICKEQESFFNSNRNIFDESILNIATSALVDTSFLLKNNTSLLPDTTVSKLKRIGIGRIEIHKYSNCKTKQVKFTPDSMWHRDDFFMLEITYDPCDERNRKGYHWKLKESENKHSFGQGDGWFIYSDTDFL